MTVPAPAPAYLKLSQGLDPALCGALCGGWIKLISSSSLCHNSTNGMYLSPLNIAARVAWIQLLKYVRCHTKNYILPLIVIVILWGVPKNMQTTCILSLCFRYQQNFYQLFVLLEQLNSFRFLWLVVV